MARPVGSTQNIVAKKPSQKAIAQRIQALEALHHTALAINQQQDLNALLRAIVHRAAELLHAHMGGLYLMRPDGQNLELVVTHNLPGDFAGTVLRLGEGLSGRVAATGETMVIEDYMNWPGRAGVYDNQPFRRVVGVPLKIQDRVIGVINITDNVATGPFDPEEVRLVQLFAEHAALAIQNSRLLADTRRQNATLESLYELAVAITGVQDQETLLSRLCEQAAHLLHFDAFGVALCEDPPGTTYHLALAVEEGRPVPEIHDRHIPFSAGGLTGWVLQTRQPLLLTDTEKQPMPVPSRVIGRLTRSWLGVPLMVRERLLGAVVVQSFQPYAFDERDLHLLEAMARQVGVALESVRLARQAQQRDVILKTLADIGQQLLASKELEAVLPDVLARLGRAASVSRCYIFENHRDADGTLLMSQRYEWVMPGIKPQIDNPQLQSLPYTAFGSSHWIDLLSAGRPVHGLVAHFPAAERAILEPQGILSIALVPIFSEGLWWGYIGFDDCVTERIWTPAEIETLRSAAAILGAAFARRRAEQAERQRRMLAEALRETALALTGTLSLETVLDRIMANARQVVPSDGASLMLVDGDLARVVRVSGYEEHGLTSAVMALTFRISETPNLSRMMTTRQPVLVQDVRAFEGWKDIPPTQWIRSYLGAPIESEGTVVGFLNLDFARPNAVPAEGPQLLQAFAAQAGIALANAGLYRVLEASAERVRQLAQDLMRAQEIERQTLARELHDEMGQALTALLLNLGVLERSLAARGDPSILAHLAEARWLAEQMAARTRELLLDLRPPALDDLGLIPALRWYLERFGQRAGLRVDFRVSGQVEDVPADVKLAVYRIVQEATTNISRHAHAQQLQVEFSRTSDNLWLIIKDDGRGFDSRVESAAGVPAQGVGLLSMRERAQALGGEFSIESWPGRGTQINVRIPLSRQN